MSVLFKLKRRLCWGLFALLPKRRNKVVLQSFYGRGFSDSPKAIAQELLRRGGHRLYWVVKSMEEAESLPEEITPILLDSVKSIYHLCTAGVWVDNSRKWSFTKKSRGQYYVQTWHGFPLKRIEKDAGDALPADYIQSAKKDSEMCDLLLSDGAFLSQVYRNGFWYDGEILAEGFPRNDVLVRGNPALAEQAVKKLQLPENTKFCLYAPTFRREMELDVYDMDYAQVTRALSRRFGGNWLILAKLHPNVAVKAGQLQLDPAYVRNVSDYSDIQELYLLSDAMISDYSSVMFDFINTRKPCFLYVNDLQAYQNDRNFYYDLSRLPFEHAENNQALVTAIADFDSQCHLERLDAFCLEFGIRETGFAAKAAVDRIVEHTGC